MYMILNESSNSYQRKYKCPYCETKYTKDQLIKHIESKHSDSIPDGYTPSRIVFNLINKKDHGTCIECHGESPWNESKCRYERLCGKPACMVAYKKRTEDRIKRMYGKTSKEMLHDPNHQQKMLAGRRISGVYTWKDGTLSTYTGKYELECLKFCETFGFASTDIITPGPVINYTYGGEKHIWITDIYIAPYNLAIDCKDGGDNPNKRDMKEYRAKQIAKEKAIATQGKYNYLRLTNNNFDQLIEVITLLKLQFLENNQNERIIKINENMFASIASFIPPDNTNDVYIVNYLKNNVFSSESELALSNNIFFDNLITQDEDGKIIKVDKSYLEDTTYNVYHCKNKSKEINEICSNIGNIMEDNYIYESLFNHKYYCEDQLLTENIVEVFDIYSYNNILKEMVIATMKQPDISLNTVDDNVYIDENGYYMTNDKKTLRTISRTDNKFSNIEKFILKNEGDLL